jgi:hypothetical protein
MIDKRKEILNTEYIKFVNDKCISSMYPKSFPEAYKEVAINAMDENGKQMCLDLLEYMAKNSVNAYVAKNGISYFMYKGQWLTKEKIFENFL